MQKGFLVLTFIIAVFYGYLPGQVVISIDADSLYQRMSGWEATAWVAEPNDPALPNFKDTLYSMVINDIGINRVRLEIRSGVENTNDNWSDYQDSTIDYDTWRSGRYATVDDNGDPDSIDWSGFHYSEMDWTIENVVIPLQQLCEARGEHLYINVNYVAFTAQIQGGSYHHDDPDEYAEYVLAAYLHMQNKYGFVPDAWEPVLEPDNVSQWNGTNMGQAMAATAAKLTAHGFTPRFIAPSNTNMGNAVTYFDAMIQVAGVLPYLKEFSYHRYSGVSDANLQAIASRAVQYGIKTSMLEWWNDNNNYNLLYKDLTMGRNSAFQQYVLAGLFDIDKTNPQQPVVSIRSQVRFTRQYYKFVRYNAQRIHAASGSAVLQPLAFINPNGSYVTVINASGADSFSIQGLPAGGYGIKYTTASEYDIDALDVMLSDGQALSSSIPAAGVITVYQKSGSNVGITHVPAKYGSEPTYFIHMPNLNSMTVHSIPSPDFIQSIRLYSVKGVILETLHPKQKNVNFLCGENLPAGMYIIQAETRGKMLSRRAIIVK